MMAWLCWLVGACAATTPLPAPPPSAPVVQPVPSLGDTVFGIAPLPPAPIVVAPPPPPVAAPPPSVPAGPAAWRRNAVPAPPAQGRPTITIVIDEMGVATGPSARTIALPGPLTLSWLPYAPRLAEQIAAAAALGHEAMLDMPMEALGRADPGPDALRTWLPPATNLAMLRAALVLVPTAVALNQREGSVASLSVPVMDLVMVELRARGMAFLDSAAIPHAVAFARAEAAGLESVGPDLFIDNDPDPAAIRARLAESEEIARKRGHAILIGRPRQTTLDVLEQYLPTLAERGFVLWPISARVAAATNAGTDASSTASAAIAPLKPTGAE